MAYNSKYTGAEVDNALSKALTAIQEHQDISGKQDVISDLAEIRANSKKGATALQSVPSEYVTETELNAKGYTTNVGTITGIKMNGASKGTSGVVDLGTVITKHQDISGKLDIATAASTYLSKVDASNLYLGKTAKASSASSADVSTKATQDASGNVITTTYATKTEVSNKQDKVLKFTNKSATTWVSDSTYSSFPYRCDISCSGVTSDMFAEVVFNIDESTSGNYAPVCETKANIVSIWSSVNESITIPTIIITK